MKTRSTALKTYLECPRKFWYAYGPQGRPRPASKAQLIGTAVHHELEAFAKGLTPQEMPLASDDEEAADLIPAEGFSPLAQSALPIVRMVLAGAEVLGVELRFEGIELAPDLELSGTIDLLLLRGDILVVHDYKTTSGWQWAKTAEGLSRDLQMITYAWVALHHLRPDLGVRVVRLQHLALHKGECRSRLTHVDLSPEEIDTRFSQVLALALKAQRDYSLPVTQVHPDRSACGNFGGCPYEGACSITPTGDDTMSFLNLVRKSTAAVGIQPPDAQPELAPVPPAERSLESLKSVTPKVAESLSSIGLNSAGLLALTEDSTLTDLPGVGPKRLEAIREELSALGLASPAPAPAPAPPLPRPPAPPAPPAPSPSPLVLYVDCAPQSRALPRLSSRPEIGVAVEKVLAKHRATNLLLVPYNQGIRDLTAFAATLEWVGGWRCDSGSSLDRAVYDAVVDLGAEVVR